MARYLTPGMVVLADGHPSSNGILASASTYAQHTVAVTAAGVDSVPGITETVAAGRKGLTLDRAFRHAAESGIPWVGLRRDRETPARLIGEALAATGKRASGSLPGFAVVFGALEFRPIERILAVVDRSDGQPSGLLVMIAVGATAATGARLDVLVIGAPGESLEIPAKAADILRIERDEDLYAQALQRASEQGIAANWLVAADVADKQALVLQTLADGGYDLVIDDLGSVKLGGRFGRSGRIAKALSSDGPGGIARSVLESSDVSLVLVLDAVRLGVVAPAVVKGGAGALLAFGMLASAAPAASARAERTEISAAVDAAVADYNEALTQASGMASAEEVASAQETAAASAAHAEAVVAGTPVEADPARPAAGDDDAAQTEDVAEPPAAPSTVAPETVVPAPAAPVDASAVAVPETVTLDTVTAAQQAEQDALAALQASQAAFTQEQAEATATQQALTGAAATAQEAATALDLANQEYRDTTAQTEAVLAESTGIGGIVPGGASRADVEAAEAAESAALQGVEDAGVAADQALSDYQAAAAADAQADAELQEAASEVSAADSAYQAAVAANEATRAAYDEAMANARVSPVPGYAITTAFGVPGPHWSTGYHTGVDYAAPEGADVVAAASGTVVYAQNDGGSYGNRVVVEHADGYSTTYNHLSSIDVEVGQEVTAGDKVGEVGNTGNSFGAHLHFEVTQGGDGWSSGSFVDPAAWLAGEIG